MKGDDPQRTSASVPDGAAVLTAIDLFSGAGGLTLGLKQAGFRVLAGVELEDVPANTFRENHPEALLHKSA